MKRVTLGKAYADGNPSPDLPLLHSESQAGPAVELGLAIY